MSNKLLHPTMSLLCKLGSIVVHADEALSSDGHQFDYSALRQLMNDSEVQEWTKQMREEALLPVKRKP